MSAPLRNFVVTTSPRVLHLDGLRGIAIALVLVHHFVVPSLDHNIGSVGAYVGVALSLSYTGVDLFFVLSGYLIGGIILNHRDAPGFSTAFYIRRSARILPLALLCIGMILCAQWAGLYGLADGGKPWPMPVYLLFGTNLWMAAAGDWGYRPLSPLWSLAIEEQFYLVIPWFLRFVPSAQTSRVLTALIGLALAARLGLLATGVGPLSASLLPFARMDSLGAGLLVAWIVRSRSARTWCLNHRLRLIGLLILLATACSVLVKLRAANGSAVMAAGGYTLIAGFFGTVLLLLETQPSNGFHRALSLRPLVLLGRYSYFLYLFQGLVIGLTVSLVFDGRLAVGSPHDWIQLAVGFVGLFVLAAMSWHWLESPLIDFGRRWAYSSEAKTA